MTRLPRPEPDQRSLEIVVSRDEQQALVWVEFAQCVSAVGLHPPEAVAIAQSLIRHARAVSKEPLTVEI